MAGLSKFYADQHTNLPLVTTSKNCSGCTFIVTGANTGLGFEASKHLVAAGASKVILACRNTKAGEEARQAIVTATNKPDVPEVWGLDLSSYDSIRAFVKRAENLPRIDAIIENAGVAGVTWEMWESELKVNVLGTFYLAILILPKLERCAKALGIMPRMSIVASATGFHDGTKKEWDKFSHSNAEDLLEKLNVRELAEPWERYPFSKLLTIFMARYLAYAFPVSKTSVIINIVNPGLCKTSLSRHGTFILRKIHGLMSLVMARSSEMGSRTLLHGAFSGEESHGNFLSTCKLSEDEVPSWVTDEEGQKGQKMVWEAITRELESVDPGFVDRASRP